ncbi:MAG: hypothetical protein AMXMBFR84_37390 [Candidatus Hydrogenedentota bacterium]
MRICILTKSEPYAWTRHYVHAFRQTGADVLTVGPTISVEHLESMKLGHLAESVIPNDIHAVLEPGFPLVSVLPEGFRPDLIVAVSVGGETLAPSFEGLRCPRAYISVDTWQSPRDYMDAIQYDFVFAAQREAVSRLLNFGARNVSWLPLGCNPDEHYPTQTPVTADVSFVGSIALPIHQERYDLLQRLQREFNVAGRSGLYGEGLCHACRSGALTFNHSAVGDVNMRIFEALAMGCPLLTNREPGRNGLFELFEEGKHLVVYDGEDDLVAKVRYYLDHERERLDIAESGRRWVLARHTYLHRVQVILQTIFGDTTARQALHAVPPADLPVLKLIPYAPAKILDTVGGGRLAEWLPLLGATEMVRVGDQPGCTMSLDELHQHNGCFDTALATGIPAEGIHHALKPGGTLLLELSPLLAAQEGLSLEGNAICEWLLKRGYIMQTGTLVTEPDGTPSTIAIAARKRTRTLMELIDETYQPLPKTCYFVKDWIENWIKTLPRGI